MRRAAALQGAASAPAFAELRNLLVPLSQNVTLARAATGELADVGRHMRAQGEQVPPEILHTWLEISQSTVGDLVELLSELETVVVRVQASILALEKVSVPSADVVSVNEVLLAARELAQHGTKLVGGVEWPPEPCRARIATPRASATGALAALMTKAAAALAAERSRGGLRVSVSSDATHVEVQVGVTLPLALTNKIANIISELVARDAGIECEAGTSVVVLRFPRAGGESESVE